MNENTFKPVPVVYPMQMTKEVDTYREPGDPEHIVRFNIPIVNNAIRVGKNVPVAGVTFRMDDVNSFAFGCHQWCSLEFEPTNPYDKNAIKVIGYWDEDESFDRPAHGHIGYIPKTKAKLWVGKVLIAKLKVIYMPINGRTVGIRIDVWEMDAKQPSAKPIDTGYVPLPPPNFEKDWLDE